MMRLFLNIILIFFIFFSCYVEDLYLFLQPPQPEETIPLTIRCYQSFNFDQEKALGEKRKLALSQYVPLYTYTPDKVDSAKGKIENLIQKVTVLQERNRSGKELANFLRKEFDLEIPWGMGAKLLWYSNFKNLLEGILTIEESILKSKIVEDPEPLNGKKVIDILYPDPAGTVAHPTDDLLSLEQARLTLQEKAKQLFWQVDKNILDSVLQICLATLEPNLKYDQRENDRRIEEIIRRYPSKVIPYNSGDVLVPFRKVMDDKDVLLLTAYQEEKRDIYGSAIWILVAVLLMLVLYNFFLSKILAVVLRKEPPYVLLLSLLILTIFLLKTCLLFTPFPVYVLPLSLLLYF